MGLMYGGCYNHSRGSTWWSLEKFYAVEDPMQVIPMQCHDEMLLNSANPLRMR
jgi:hypothetical protein